MLRVFGLAIFALSAVSALVRSETFMATLIKVEGNMVTYKKTTYHSAGAAGRGPKYTYAPAVTVEATKDAAITRGHFLPVGDNTSTGRLTGKQFPVDGGLGNKLFKGLAERKTPLRPGLITIADKG